MKARKYQITACDVPPSVRPGRSSLYSEIVADFLEKGIQSGRMTPRVQDGAYERLAGASRRSGRPPVRRRGDHSAGSTAQAWQNSCEPPR